MAKYKWGLFNAYKIPQFLKEQNSKLLFAFKRQIEIMIFSYHTVPLRRLHDAFQVWKFNYANVPFRILRHITIWTTFYLP